MGVRLFNPLTDTAHHHHSHHLALTSCSSHSHSHCHCLIECSTSTTFLCIYFQTDAVEACMQFFFFFFVKGILFLLCRFCYSFVRHRSNYHIYLVSFLYSFLTQAFNDPAKEKQQQQRKWKRWRKKSATTYFIGRVLCLTWAYGSFVLHHIHVLVQCISILWMSVLNAQKKNHCNYLQQNSGMIRFVSSDEYDAVAAVCRRSWHL